LAALGLILYLQFYQTFRVIGFTPSWNLARWKLTTANVSFLVLAFSASVIVFYLSLQRLSRSRIYKFREFVSELGREKRYAELFSLVERNLPSLARIYHADFALSRAREFFEKRSNPYSIFLSLSESHELPKRRCTRLDSVKMSIFGLMKGAFPAYQSEKNAAGEVLQEVLLNARTIKGMIKARPYCALQFYGWNFYEFQEFFERYLDSLVRDSGSMLYHEIRHNQNLSHGHAYHLPDRNRLLAFLFQDCSIAENWLRISQLVMQLLQNWMHALKATYQIRTTAQCETLMKRANGSQEFSSGFVFSTSWSCRLCIRAFRGTYGCITSQLSPNTSCAICSLTPSIKTHCQSGLRSTTFSCTK